MKTEPNDFGPDLYVKTAGPAVKASPKASPRPKAELFARITERHCTLLADVERPSTVILFHHLMMYSVKVFHQPFELPVEYLTKKTGMNRRRQLRAVRSLVEVGIIKDNRKSRYDPPIITIPGTSKTGHKAT